MSLKSKWLKGLLSFYLIYHLAASLVLPNQRSYIEQHFGWLFYPYASTLGLNTPWQFFSPNPSRNIYFEYEPVFDDSDHEIQSHRWPPDKGSSGMIGSNHMRLVYHSRFSTSSDLRKLHFFANYFCRKYSGAHAISLKTIMLDPPSMEQAAISDQPLKDQIQVKEWPAELFECEQALAPLSGVVE